MRDHFEIALVSFDKGTMSCFLPAIQTEICVRRVAPGHGLNSLPDVHGLDRVSRSSGSITIVFANLMLEFCREGLLLFLQEGFRTLPELGSR